MQQHVATMHRLQRKLLFLNIGTCFLGPGIATNMLKGLSQDVSSKWNTLQQTFATSAISHSCAEAKPS
jgi:hypothetical protein